MKHFTFLLFFLFMARSSFALTYEELTRNFVTGKADVQSMSVLSFGPEGILFIGDSKAGKIFALDLNDRVKNNGHEPFKVLDIESKLAGALGVGVKEVVIHDLAVNPFSQAVYLAVSRADAMRVSRFILPNDIAYATILIKVKSDGSLEEVPLDNIRYSVTDVPKVIETGKQKNFRGSDDRTDAITDLSYDDGKLYVAGLSNEAFQSALRILNFPFDKEAVHSSIEVFHVAHERWETEAPIRTLFPYNVNGEKVLLASFTCTPFVSIPLSAIQPGAHVKTKTLAEFGDGNLPIDIIAAEIRGKKYILMSNSSKALIRIDPENLAGQKELTEPRVSNQYTSGLPHDVLSNVGISQLDNLNDHYVLALQRQPNGSLDLWPIQIKWD